MKSKIYILSTLAGAVFLAACQSKPMVDPDAPNPLALQEAVDVLYTSTGKSWNEMAKITGVRWSAAEPLIQKNHAALSGLLVDSNNLLVAEGSSVRVNKVKFSRPAVQSNADLLRSVFNQNIGLKAVTLECTAERAVAYDPAFYVMELNDNIVYAQAMVMAGAQGPLTELSFTRYRPNEEINKYGCQ